MDRTTPHSRNPRRARSPAAPGRDDLASGTVVTHIAAIGIFFTIFAVALTYLLVVTPSSTGGTDTTLASHADSGLSLLTETSGLPPDWETTTFNPDRLGLLKPGTSVTMSRDKLEGLQPGGIHVNYSNATEALGLGGYEWRLETRPVLTGEANRTALERYRVGYIARYDGDLESTRSKTETDTLEETAVTFNNSRAGGANLLSNPGDQYKNSIENLTRHLTTRLAGLWFNDDGTLGSLTEHTWWHMVDTHRTGIPDLDAKHRNVLTASNWTGSAWNYADGETDRIYAVKADLTGYEASDTVWFNFTHYVNGVGTDLLDSSDHGKIQTRPVHASDLDAWDTEHSGAFFDNGTATHFANSSVKITENIGSEIWIAFLWESTEETAEDEGWFISNWTLEAEHNGRHKRLASNDLDYETTRHDALVGGQGISHGEVSSDPVKDHVQQWIEAGGDFLGMAPQKPASSTEFLDPWISAQTEEDVRGDVDPAKSNTSHALLRTPTAMDWGKWPMTDYVYGVEPSDDFVWVLTRDDPEDDEHEPALAVSQINAGGGDLILSSQKATDMGDDARRHYVENALTILRYRGLYLDYGATPTGHHAVGGAQVTTLVDAQEGSLNHPNFEVTFQVWE